MNELSLGLVEVRFVGGPLHGTHVQMENPPFKMDFELAPSQVIEYCRRIVETTRDEHDGKIAYAATYAPSGTSESEFVRFVLNAARL